MVRVQNDLPHVTCGNLAGFTVLCNQGAPVSPSEEPWSLESRGSAKLFGSQAPVLLLSADIFLLHSVEMEPPSGLERWHQTLLLSQQLLLPCLLSCYNLDFHLFSEWNPLIRKHKLIPSWWYCHWKPSSLSVAGQRKHMWPGSAQWGMKGSLQSTFERGCIFPDRRERCALAPSEPPTTPAPFLHS